MTRYDPRLPILAELEREVERAATRRLGEPAPGHEAERAPGRGGRRSARRRRHLWRVPRRTAVLVGLICLVGASATATILSRRSDGPARGGADATVSRAGGPNGYELRLHASGRRVCTAFVLRDSLDTVCVRPPRGRGAIARSAVAPFARYVYGLTARSVSAVDVRVGAQRRRVATRALPAAAARRVAPAAGLRVFVVALRRGDDDPVALVRVQGRQRTIVDCSLGQIDDRCKPR